MLYSEPKPLVCFALLAMTVLLSSRGAAVAIQWPFVARLRHGLASLCSQRRVVSSRGAAVAIPWPFVAWLRHGFASLCSQRRVVSSRGVAVAIQCLGFGFSFLPHSVRCLLLGRCVIRLWINWHHQ